MIIILIKIDIKSDTPVYQQLKNKIIIAIGTGSLPPGYSLPSVRALAAELGLNNMTINKVYSQLKEEGYIYIDRRHGAFVKEKDKNEVIDERTKDKIKLLIAETNFYGVSRETFIKYCNEIYENMITRGGNKDDI